MRLQGVIQYSPTEIRAIQNAIAYIDSNPEKPITAEELASDYQIGIKKLQNGFIRITGLTVHYYLLQVRLEKAKELLADLDLPLKTIAYKVGFRTRSHFGQFFKKYTGQTPVQYRFGNGV